VLTILWQYCLKETGPPSSMHGEIGLSAEGTPVFDRLVGGLTWAVFCTDHWINSSFTGCWFWFHQSRVPYRQRKTT